MKIIATVTVKAEDTRQPRLNWGQVRPYTRVHKSGKEYDRNRAKRNLRKEVRNYE